ncbi:sam domain family protein, partial [Moniliophthora roreri]
ILLWILFRNLGARPGLWRKREYLVCRGGGCSVSVDAWLRGSFLSSCHLQCNRLSDSCCRMAFRNVSCSCDACCKSVYSDAVCSDSVSRVNPNLLV